MAVALSGGVGPAAAAGLLAAHGSFLAVVQAACRQLDLTGSAMSVGTRAARGVSARAMPDGVAGSIRASVRSGEYARELEVARRAGARFGVPGDDDYPGVLAEVANAPVGVYVMGDRLASLVPMVGVVGTRTPTPRGAAIAAGLAADLARDGVTVVSGMARGVDSQAHRGAMEAGGRTVAVMGCGLSHTYPPENQELRREIVVNGSLVSEFTMNAEPTPGRFPRRNRVIAGLSAGVVVVEAAARSGALITAARALEQGREVFAVPGPIDEPLSVGPNRLIKAGAKLVEDAGDVLDELDRAWGPFPVRRSWQAPGPSCPPRDGEDSSAGFSADAATAGLPRALAAAMSLTPVSVDELVASTGAPVQDVLAALLRLELDGRVERTAGGRFVRGPRLRVSGGSRSR